MPSKKNYKDFESAINRLEEITALLENGEATLEESIELYTEGLEIAKYCSTNLNGAEKKIKMIMEKNGSILEVDFDEGRV